MCSSGKRVSPTKHTRDANGKMREKPVLMPPEITHTLREIIDPRIHQATNDNPATVTESASNSPRNRARNSDDGGATSRR